MPDLDFLVHLPFLRIDQELLPFAGARLYRAPFEKYDEISLGAFSEQRARYEATEPVFLSFSISIPEEGLERRVDEVKSLKELKMPSSRPFMLDQLGLHAINWAHKEIVTPTWTALLLAVPAAALAPPRWSQTFMSIDGGFTFNLAGQPAVGVRVQGEADHEYLFQPDAPSQRILATDIARAADLFAAVRQWEQIPDLHAALTALRVTGLPTLSRQDRLTIAVQALESLLLPEVRTSLKRTFARRAAALLATDHDSAERITSLARDLYGLRSESVHGSALLKETEALDGALAEQMVAGAIQALGKLVKSGQTVDELRAKLDKGYPVVEPAEFRIEAHPTGRASDYRLAPRIPSSDVFSLTSSMAAAEGRVCSWSPLLGLTSEGLEESGGMAMSRPPVPVLMPFSPKELYDLEERDIRRDFFAEFVVHGYPMTVFFIASEDETATAEDATPWLERMRDLGVVTLRLAGYDRFHDPELFGSAVFEGSRRLRRPTALRQTVAEEIRHEATQRVGPADRPRLAEIWNEVWRYDHKGRNSTIEDVLSLFRRSFDRDFLEPEQRGLILVSLLDRMLGRFRAPGDAVQLEDLVAALVEQNEDVAWFRKHGRRYRNRVAHGEFTNDDAGEPIECMSRLISRLVLALITSWNSVEHRDQSNPSQALLERASSLVKPRAAQKTQTQ